MLISIFCLFIVWCAQTYVAAQCPTIIHKKEWDAIKTSYRPYYLATPVDLVIMQHTVTQTCNNDKTCAEVVRDLQKIHIQQSYLWDIGFSFLIGNNGKVYEGRGWNHVGIHTYGYNNQSIGIAFIGNFNNQEPSVKALESVKALIRCGVEDERLTEDHVVVLHNQLLPTESPGKKLSSKIMSWPNWKKDVSDIKNRADKQEKQQVPTENENQSKSKDFNNDMVLVTPKKIDLLSNLRDVITELINNLRDLALQTLKTVDELTRGLIKETDLFYDTMLSGLNRVKQQFSSTADTVSSVPGIGKCVQPIKQKANSIYDNTEAKARACANDKIDEIKDMINVIKTSSSDVIIFSDDAVEKTKNCTELNYGIQSNTKACLESVAGKTKNAKDKYEKQKNNAITSINTALEALPKALDMCATKHLTETNVEIGKLTSSITDCPKKPLESLWGFGFRNI